MSALLLVLALAAMYVGIIETAFSTLMRLSLRLMAERGGRSDRLGYYLEDPIQLFVPARLMLGLIFPLATVVLTVLTGRTGFNAIGMLLVFVAVFILAVRARAADADRAPQSGAGARVRPAAFDYVARALHPLTGTLVRLLVEGRRDRDRPGGQPLTATEEEAGETAHAYLEAGEEQGLIEGDERRMLQSIVDFGTTLVREVMTPRPDMVAIRADATLDELGRCSGSRSTPAFRSIPRTSTTSWASSSSRISFS